MLARHALIFTTILAVLGCQPKTGASEKSTTPVGGAIGPAPAVSYTFQTNQTTSYGPAQADVLTSGANWIPCRGTFALCYYSGPEGRPTPTTPALSCTVTADGQFANCDCPVMAGDYQVDVNAILDVAVFSATTTTGTPNASQCCVKSGDNWDCSGCAKDAAAVCDAIDRKTLYTGTAYDSVSTFSAVLSADGTPYKIDLTQCETPSPYAGCMTAPCVDQGRKVMIEKSEYPVHTCTCPTWKGPFQVGTPLGAENTCALGGGAPGGNVWSAAYAPNLSQ